MNANCGHPSWSPNGEQLLHTVDLNNRSSLQVLNQDGSNPRPLTFTGFEGRDFFNPGFSSDGQRITFVVKGLNGAPDLLYTAGLDGSQPIQIGPSGLSIFEYDYSPTLDLIVFDARVTNQSVLGNWDIFTMKAGGTNVRRLTQENAMNSRPKWLSDGRTIVFHSNRYGSGIDQPNENALLDEWLRWWNQFELCTMNFDGTDVRRLTNNERRDLHPDG